MANLTSLNKTCLFLTNKCGQDECVDHVWWIYCDICRPLMVDIL